MRAGDLTPAEETFNKLIFALEGGNRVEVALLHSGMDMHTYRELRKDPVIRKMIDEARATSEMVIVESMREAAKQGNTVAAAWILERVSGTDAYMTEPQRRAEKMARERWKLEQQIIAAELEADPMRAAQMITGKKVRRKKRGNTIDVNTTVGGYIEGEVVESGGESEADQ